MEKIEIAISKLLPEIDSRPEVGAMLRNALKRAKNGDLTSAYWILRAFVLGCDYARTIKENDFVTGVHRAGQAVYDEINRLSSQG